MCMACGLGFGEDKVQYHPAAKSASMPRGDTSAYSERSSAPYSSRQNSDYK